MAQSTALIKLFVCLISLCTFTSIHAQNTEWDKWVSDAMLPTLERHRTFVSIPNVSPDPEQLEINMDWIQPYFEALDFKVRRLKTHTTPIFLASRIIDENAKTLLFYFHLDGQAVNPENWDQEDPFVPVLKAFDESQWKTIDWNRLKENIDPAWRIFGRAAADDKGPISMMLTALEIMQRQDLTSQFNIKILLDPEEESGSDGFIETIDQYRADYAADYMIIMDGPAHNSNRPTLTFGCRGIARCNITIYGAKLPQHSGHYGNYAPNPVFRMAHLLSSMKSEKGKVLIDGFYDDIPMTGEIENILKAVPDQEETIKKGLVIAEADEVGAYYQQSLQYPSLNVRHIETSWKGPGLKTVIPEYVTAHLDVRLVSETDGKEQIKKVREHIADQGFYVIDRSPTDEERLTYPLIATFNAPGYVNAFRTEIDSRLGQTISAAVESAFGEAPVRIRTMGGTVPIIPAVNALEIPAIIVPMVNMDNNQHNPNENIRIGNIETGIKICLAILNMGE